MVLSREDRILPPTFAPLLDGDPRQLGVFQLSGRLGRGGMATAYLGDDGQRWAVVKVVHPHLADDMNFRKRLRRELDTMQRAAGGAAAVLDQDLQAQHPWFAVEYVEGQTLAERVEAVGALSGRTLIDFAVGLAHRIEILHRAGITHRDIKPSNLVISPDGVRLIDFGIAVGEDDTALTAVGGTVGTLAWSAPEQVSGDDVGPPADIHAWGLCTLFAATGQDPFSAGTTAHLIYQVIHTTPQIPNGLPPGLAPAIEGALSKNPQARPTAVDLMNLDLNWITQPPAVASPGVSTAKPTIAIPPASAPTVALPPGNEQTAGSNKAILVLTALALAAMVVGVGAMFLSGRETAESADSPTGSGGATVPVPSTPAPPTTNPGTCLDSNIKVTVEPDAPTYSVGTTPEITLAIQNIGIEACSRDIGADANSIEISSGGVRVWSSDDCEGVGGADVQELDSQAVASVTIPWPRTISGKGCPVPPDKQPEAQPNSYQVVGKNLNVTSAPVEFRLE